MTYTFISSKNEMSEGLFGMVILFIFSILPILELINVNINDLKWDISTLNYGEIFPNLLEYNSKYIDIDFENDKTVINMFDLMRNKPQFVLGDNFSELNKLFFKYFKIPKHIKDKADIYDLNDCLGLHFRGTDKTTDLNMNNPITKNEFYIILDSFLCSNKDIKNIFLATDENDMLNYLKNKYEHINVKTSRDLNHNLFWKNNNNIIKNGEEAMIDMLCLSKCKVVLKVSSALSSFSKLINPNLEIYRLNALKMFTDIPYFPDAYIPLLKINKTFTDECNSILNKIQKDDWSKMNFDKFNNFTYKLR